MDFKFDPDLDYQGEAIAAVVDLFDGQPVAPSEFELASSARQQLLFAGGGVGNALLLGDEQIRRNLEQVQERNGIPHEMRGLDDDGQLQGLDFSVEMETGTGKTYVYLRAILELHVNYGWSKFVIVVPSVAIREGVLSNLRLLESHFARLYDGIPYEFDVYDSSRLERLRHFAQSSQLQILLLNIDAFNKTDINIIHQPHDRMNGLPPIDLIRACSPVVVLDEPHRMASEGHREAIDDLHPLITLRYSATHRDPRHLIYRLTPVDAYEQRLVKQIEVLSIQEEPDANAAYVGVESISAGKKSFSAKLLLDVQGQEGVKRKEQAVRVGDDLREVTGRDVYEGWIVEQISRDGHVDFVNGIRVHQGGEHGPNIDDIQRLQIRLTIEEHFNKVLDLGRRAEMGDIEPTKVLSLFFIDRVDHYYGAEGKFRRWFEEEYERLSRQPKFRELGLPPAEDAHDGYFARDRSGAPRDSKTGTAASDRDAYEIIMRDKGRLLSMDEPLSFVFSHSALQEGWDNPNVFVLCTLQETQSAIRKRQQLGRGLRLPVMQDGSRCQDDNVNRLVVVANESYERFAATLQQEIEEDVGVQFDKANVKNRRKRAKVEVNEAKLGSEEFLRLWERIKSRTRYRVDFDGGEVISKAAGLLESRLQNLQPPRLKAVKAQLDMDSEGVSTDQLLSVRQVEVSEQALPIPDILTHLTRQLDLSRHTIAEALIRSERLGDITVNPQAFLDTALTVFREVLEGLLASGVVYERVETGPDATYELSLFRDRQLEGYEDSMVAVENSVFDHVIYDSEDPERRIATEWDKREDIPVFVKLPSWFTIDTPIGSYNPDWALVKSADKDATELYFVRESKATASRSTLRAREEHKAYQYAPAHFKALDEVSFAVIDSPDDV